MMDIPRLLQWQFPEMEHVYTERDTILYALGLGLGHDPTAPTQLKYLYEDGLEALPPMATILAHPGVWISNSATGIDWKRAVHGEHELIVHHPIPPRGTVLGRMHVESIADKGYGRGAVLYTSREIIDAETGTPTATVRQGTFCRGDGGCGSSASAISPIAEKRSLPERAPDMVHDMQSLPQAALIYRLSGDWNPLHVSPEAARAAGFDRPILHGLCTFGMTSVALLLRCCGGQVASFAAIRGRFTAPFYPGETLRVEIWSDGADRFRFRSAAMERGVIVVDDGSFERAARGGCQGTS